MTIPPPTKWLGDNKKSTYLIRHGRRNNKGGNKKKRAKYNNRNGKSASSQGKKGNKGNNKGGKGGSKKGSGGNSGKKSDMTVGKGETRMEICSRRILKILRRYSAGLKDTDNSVIV